MNENSIIKNISECSTIGKYKQNRERQVLKCDSH